MRGNQRVVWGRVLVLTAAMAVLWVEGSRAALPPEEIPPDAVPQIQQVSPGQVAAGDEVTLVVEGQNFAAGAYVSFGSPWIHVISTRRDSGTKLEAKVSVNKKAQAGSVSLFVSNPASTASEIMLAIVEAGSPAPAAPAAEEHTTEAGTPEVKSIDPPQAAPGSEATLKITGKNFAQGAKVSFGNPGIQILETTPTDTTVLTVRIRIASDAPAGKTGVFVLNPNDTETEASFEVGGSSPASTPKTATTTATTVKPADATAQRFDVYNLGDVTTILQTHNKTKGTLVVVGKKLTYEESGKEVFSTALADIKEVEVNSYLGFNTGTFHIILKSGQTYHFVASSLRPADSQSIVNSLQKAIR